MSFLLKPLEKWREKRRSSRTRSMARGSSQEVNVTVSQPPTGETVEQDIASDLELQHEQNAAASLISQEESTQQHTSDSTPAAVLQPEIAKAPVTPPESIWNNAYDKLSTKEPKLVQTYEKILSLKLSRETADPLDLTTEENIVERDNVLVRRAQLHQLIQDGLEKTAREAKAKENMGTAMQVVNATKKLVTDAIRDIPQAALPWAMVSVSLEMLMNPISEAKSNQEGLEYIGTTIQWYWEPTTRLFDGEEGDGVKKTLYSAFVDLYESLLQFQMSSICSYYRNRGFVLLRDVVKLDDWEGKFKSIRKADDVLRKKINTFLGLEAKSHLKDLVDHTKVQERYHQTKEDQQCLRDLRITDPRADRNRIEETKGGLLQESYRWILENPQFQTWRDSEENRLLWLRGDPGKGKTMLLCGLVKELRKQSASCPVTFFFCQATDPTINNHISVLRGLMWLLADQRPSLISHIRQVYDTAGKSAFNEGNAWYTLSDIFKNMLGDEGLPLVHIVIDALDECTTGMTELLGFIQKTSLLHNVKWIVSSRNWTEIDEKLNQEMNLSLEVNAKLVETAVDAYISRKASQIAILREDDDLKEKVCSQIREKANGTFLWAAIVIQRLNSKAYYDDESEILGLLDEMPQDLSKLYALMLERTSQLKDKGPELCRAIMAIATLAHRPLHLDELSCLVGFKGNLSKLPQMEKLVNDCGSFLTVREDIVYFIHQSAKDYLADDPSSRTVVFPFGEERIHFDMVSNSLDAMKLILRENIYKLDHLGILIDEISPPDPTPLRRILYSCTDWVAHLCEVASSKDHFRLQSNLVSNEEVLGFLETHFLHWLEALSLTRNLPSNTRDIKRLSGLLKTTERDELQAFVHDASRFMQYHAQIMESTPMQIYVSALLFSPTETLVRTRCGGKLSSWISLRPITERIWSPCLQVIEANIPEVDSSGTNLLIWNIISRDVEIWDATSGKRSQILSHAETVKYAMFLSDSGRILTFTKRLACFWDANSGTKLGESNIHDLDIDWRGASVSSDGRLVASYTENTVQICDLVERTKQQTPFFASSNVRVPLRWSKNSDFLACGERGILPLNATGGLRMIHFDDPDLSDPGMAAFSSDSKLVAIPYDQAVVIWDLESKKKLLTLSASNATGHGFAFAEFSTDGRLIAARCIFSDSLGSAEGVIVWDTALGQVQHELRWPSSMPAKKLLWLDDVRALAAVRWSTVEIYEISERTFWSSWSGGGRTLHADQLICSADLTRVAFVSDGGTEIQVWDTTTGSKIQTLMDCYRGYTHVYAFSPDCKSLHYYEDGLSTRDIASYSDFEKIYTRQPGKGAFSLDGRFLAEAPSAERTIYFWQTSPNKAPKRLQTRRNGASVSLLCLSNNAEYLVILFVDNQLEIWNVMTEEKIWGAGDDGSWVEGDEAVLCDTCGFQLRAEPSIAVSDDGERVLFTKPGYQRMLILAKGKERISLPMCRGNFEPCFDVESPYILTQFGRIHLDKLLAPANNIESAHDHQLLTEGYGLNSDGSWVTWNGKNILWLPPAYRPWGKRVVSRDRLIMETEDLRSPCIVRFSGPPPFNSSYDPRH